LKFSQKKRAKLLIHANVQQNISALPARWRVGARILLNALGFPFVRQSLSPAFGSRRDFAELRDMRRFAKFSVGKPTGLPPENFAYPERIIGNKKYEYKNFKNFNFSGICCYGSNKLSGGIASAWRQKHGTNI